MQAEEQVDEPDENQTVSEARDELDFAVLSGIGEEKRLEDIQRAVERIVAVRANEGSENTEVLIDREQDREEIELSGVKSARETKTLDDYN